MTTTYAIRDSVSEQYWEASSEQDARDQWERVIGTKLGGEIYSVRVVRDLEKRVGPLTIGGELPSYSSLGCYPIVYLSEPGNDWLCAACATAEYNDPDVSDPTGDIYWEGPETTCDECSKVIKSACGDPEQEGKDYPVTNDDSTYY